jgi:NAD(P)H-dependent FMN reductase
VAQKAYCFVGYGSVGAARAIEQLRGVAIGQQMVPI